VPSTALAIRVRCSISAARKICEEQIFARKLENLQAGHVLLAPPERRARLVLAGWPVDAWSEWCGRGKIARVPIRA
jgi:hypothetical protein